MRSNVIGRFFKQIGNRDDEGFQARRRLFCVTWWPGRGDAHFGDELIRPVGTAVLATLHYALEPASAGVELVRRMPFRGFTGVAKPNGEVYYGKERGAEHVLDLARKGRPDGQLISRGLQMDKATDKCIEQTWKLPMVPQFPQIMLGFGPQTLPAYEETPALWRLVADRLDVGVDELSQKDPTLLGIQMRDTWQELIIPPGHDGNTTGNHLVDAEFCSQGRLAYVFENFGAKIGPAKGPGLLGIDTWNPVRGLLPRRDNPSRLAFKKLGIEPSDAMPQEVLDVVETEMRKILGPLNGLYSQDELYTALCSMDDPLPMLEKMPLEVIAESECVSRMRQVLSPEVAEQATYEDLLLAAKSPGSPLHLSRAARIQVCYNQLLDPEEAYHFRPQALGRRIEVDLWADNLRPRQARYQEKSHARGNSGSTPRAADGELVVAARQPAEDRAELAQEPS